VCTSRVRLGIDGEHVLTVGGLPVEQAILLYQRHASRIGVAIDDTPSLRQLLAALGHLPLGIQLSAASSGWLPPSQQLAHLAGLVGTRSDAGLTASIEETWRRLPPEGRTAAYLLAQMRTPLDGPRAVALLGGAVPMIQLLLDHSLVQRRRDGRLEMVRFVAEAVRVLHGPDTALDERHTRFVLEQGTRQQAAFVGPEPEGVLEEQAAWLEDLLAGWERSLSDPVRTGAFVLALTPSMRNNLSVSQTRTLLERSLELELPDYPACIASLELASLELREIGEEAGDWVEISERAVGTLPFPERAEIRLRRSNILRLLDRHADSLTELQVALDELPRSARLRSVRAELEGRLAYGRCLAGGEAPDIATVTRLERDAERVIASSPYHGIALLFYLSYHALRRGEREESVRWIAGAVDQADRVGVLREARQLRGVLGGLLIDLDPERATAVLLEALHDHRRAAEDSSALGNIHRMLGRLAYDAGDLDGAERHQQAALGYCQPGLYQALTRFHLANIALRRGETSSARNHVRRAAVEPASDPVLAAGIAALARLFDGWFHLADGDREGASAVLDEVRALAESDSRIRGRLASTWDNWVARLAREIG
jgi:tetratricopeptide (TPR) repeat protein